MEYACKRGREDLAQTFYDYFDAGEWVDSKGNPVLNWKQKFLTWCGRNEKKNATQVDDEEARIEELKKKWNIGNCV